MSAAFELIDGIPNYNLYVGGQWVRSSRNEAAESRNPATGELFQVATSRGRRDRTSDLRRSRAIGLERPGGQRTGDPARRSEDL
jgi:acyl-CoA reductase-like NAD-dependent aldehyde dehydrogenase